MLSVYVCARHIVKRRNYPQCSCVSENSLLPVGICAIFSREQFLFQHLTKKKRDIPVFRTNTVFGLVKSPPHGSRLLRRTDKSRYCVFTK